MQLGDGLGLGPPELVKQQASEQVVIPVPPTPAVQWNEEEVSPLDRLQHLRRTCRFGDGVAEVAREAVENGRVQHEIAHGVGLALEHFSSEVVDDVPVVAGERGDERRTVLPPPEGQRGEIEARGPAFSTHVEAHDVARLEGEAEDSIEKLSRLLGPETEVSGAELEQLSTGTQAPQREGGVRPRRDHEAEGRRGMVEEERHRLVDLGVLERVVVVENQDERPFVCVELVNQRGQDVLNHGCARRLEERQCLSSHLGPNGADGLDEMHPEPDGIVVPSVDGEPCKWLSLLLQSLPRREQRRLSGSGRRREERQLVAAGRKLLHESGASHELATHCWRLQLRPQDPALGAP